MIRRLIFNIDSCKLYNCIDFYALIKIETTDCLNRKTKPKMRYTILYPPPELKDFVSHFWISSIKGQSEDLNNTFHYSTAYSLANIVIAFRGSESNPSPAFSQFQGQTAIPQKIRIPDEGFVKIFGVSIYSHAIPQFFNVLASEISNQSIPLSNFWGNQDNLFTEMMAASLYTEDCINSLSDYLKSQLSVNRFKDKIVIKATNQIRQDNGNINMERLSHELNLSYKQFARRFKIHTGFNPKLYARIIRFESVLYNTMKYTSLTEAAYMNGYYDQAHCIRDFKDFTGYSPQKFFAITSL